MHILEKHSAKLLYTLSQLIPPNSLLKLALVSYYNTDEKLRHWVELFARDLRENCGAKIQTQEMCKLTIYD